MPFTAENRARLGLALIAKDEERSLPRLLASIEGAFDRVALVDTGSSDRTMQVFKEWAEGERRDGRLGSWASADFAWRDDFGAARHHADQLLSGMDWLCWADCDDEIHGARSLRQLARQAPAEVAALDAEYDYEHDAEGRCVVRGVRERLVRKGCGRWRGRVHEAQEITGPSGLIPRDVAVWVHHRDDSKNDERKATRIRILKAALRESPNDLRTLGFLVAEEAGRGRGRMAEYYFDRYVLAVVADLAGERPSPRLDNRLARVS